MMTWGHACICFFCVYVCLCVACIHVCVSVSSFACGCRCVWVYTHVRPEVNISCPPQLMSILVLESKSLTYLKLVAQWASGIHFCRHQYWGYWLVPPCLAFVWALKIWAWVPVLAQKALGQLSHLSWPRSWSVSIEQSPPYKSYFLVSYYLIISLTIDPLNVYCRGLNLLLILWMSMEEALL